MIGHVTNNPFVVADKRKTTVENIDGNKNSTNGNSFRNNDKRQTGQTISKAVQQKDSPVYENCQSK